MPATASPESTGLPLALRDIHAAVRQRDGSWLSILQIDTLTLGAAERVALVGPSGSGKSSLLALLSGLLKPRSGVVRWGGTDVATLSEASRDAWRRRHVGLVFQDFHLVPELDALANVLLPATFARTRLSPGLRRRAEALLDRVGLADPRRRAAVMSRGEQQRTALARALLHEPAILLADEPTASLDADTAARVGDLLLDTVARSGATLVVATHDPALAARLERRWAIGAGRVVAGEP